MMLAKPQAQKSNVRLLDAVGRNLPWVRGDNRRIRQILINLVSNAVKFTPEGGSVRVGAVMATGGLAIFVQDTGIGVAPEQIPKIFEPFRQIDSQQGRKHEG